MSLAEFSSEENDLWSELVSERNCESGLEFREQRGRE